MAPWRRFERSNGSGAPPEFREIRREGIRCQLRWNVGNGKVHGSTSTLDDEEHAQRHEARKAAEWIRKGFVEIAPTPEHAAADGAETTSSAPQVLEVLSVLGAKFTAIPGFEETYRHEPTPGRPQRHHHYLVLTDEGRGAISFNVRSDAHDPEAVEAFLSFVTAHRETPFDGASHHKLPLPAPIGSLSHALFCSPALGQSHIAYPAIAGRVASAFPVADCEIGDGDTEVLVDARIRGRDSIPYTRWNRDARPVVDLRFEIRPSTFRRVAKFLVFQPSDLERVLAVLPVADSESWLEVRDFRGEITRFTPETAPTYPAVMARLRG